MARPTVCTSELEAKAWDYHNGQWEKLGHTIPSHVGLADYLNVAESSLYLWAKVEGSEFSEILPAIKSKQLLTLLSKGLDGTFSAPITKLVMGKHGYHEKQDMELTGRDGEAVSFMFTGIESDGRRA